MTPITVTSSGMTLGAVNPVVFPNSITLQSQVGTLYSATAPAAYSIGQLWLDTANGNKMYRCTAVGTIVNAVGNGTTITYTTDNNHGLSASQLITIVEIDPSAYNLTGTTVASTPTTTTFTVTSSATGTYRLGGVVAGWTVVQDTAIAAAQATANSAWSAALGKNTVFYQTTAPSTSGRVAGDVWFDTDDGNKMYGWGGSAWTAYQFGTSSFQNASVDLNKLASGAVDASKLVSGAVTAGKIAASAVGTTELAANAVTAGKIAASTITGDRIAASTITGTNIAAGTITASNIAAGTITTDKLVAGTLTGFTINNGSGTFQVTSGGAITATSGTVGGFTLGSNSLTAASNSNFYMNPSTGVIQAPTLQATSTSASSINTNGGIVANGATSTFSAIDCNGEVAVGITAGGTAGRLRLYYAPAIGAASGPLVRLNSTFSYFATDSSTRRHKDNIEDAAGFDWLGLVGQLRPKTFTRIDDEMNVQNIGYIAEDLYEIEQFRYVVPLDAEGLPVAISYDYLSIYAIEALKQAVGTIQQLETRIAALEGN